MGAFRNFTRNQRSLAALLLVLALGMKLLIPAGFMLDTSALVPTAMICPDANPNSVLGQDRMAASPHDGHDMQMMSGHAGHATGDMAPEHGNQGKHGSANPCPYSVLPMASLAAADAALLAIALVFILARGFAQVCALQIVRNFHLRPPLRGPPHPIF